MNWKFNPLTSYWYLLLFLVPFYTFGQQFDFECHVENENYTQSSSYGTMMDCDFF